MSIDGSTFDEVLVLLNGIKVNDSQTGHNTLNLPVPLSAIERIEILRGPASSIYGVDALAGAINIVTRIPQQNSNSAETYDGWGIEATGTLHATNQSHTFSISHQQGNGYCYNTAYDNYRLFYSNTIRLNDKNSLQTTAGYTNNDFGAASPWRY